MNRYVTLLCGRNVGEKNIIKMVDSKTCFNELALILTNIVTKIL